MKIAIDARCLMEGRRTGVEEYLLNLILNLLEIDTKNEYVLFLNSWKNPKFDFSVFSRFKNVRIKRWRVPNKILNFSFWYLGWPHIDKLAGGADIVFMPNIIFGSVSKEAKLIVTIHDLSFERHNEYFSPKRKMWHIFINPKKICQKADKIIAVSSSSKNDLVSFYKISPEKVMVIHNGVDDKFKIINRNDEKLIKIKEKYDLPYKFILYLGTIEPRKNIFGIIRAFNRWQKKAEISGDEELTKYKLVIAGEKGWMQEKIFREIETSDYKEKIQVINFVRDEDKEYVYNLASLFVYPSFFEGFGFPPLEAMKCGVPVIASNNSSLPEVVGGGGLLIDPDKPDEIYKAMKEVLTDKKLREDITKKGLEKSLEFGWKKTARATLDLFNKA
ncbi:MAG TPA: glycosyltransferase family 1 protein [Candidatus Moranbacteria bacterium]|nr:glycosyltransferase family 1 protein [Candidatus Moranbacteria bacterium]